MIMTTDFKIEFSGDSHELDLNTLLTSLLNFSNVIQEVQQQIAPDAKVDIKVRAPERGSFLIDLMLSAPDAVGRALSLFTKDNVSLVESVFSIFVDTISIKKHLGGEPPKEVIETGDGQTSIENNSGQIIIVNQPVFNIYSENPKIDAFLSKSFQAIKNEEAIESLKVVKDEKPAIEIPNSSFEKMAAAGFASEIAERRTKVNSGVIIRAYRFSFEDYGKWGFVYEGEKITAKVSDQDFIQRVENNEPFAKGDVLKVDLAITQEYDKAVQEYLNKSFEVVKVIEHIHAARQGNLFK
ncbi:MAG: hypothetical protein R3D58_13075 [Saprospiraceae bacterium]